ncbi:MAG TPA: DUF2127 domain-containing protein [Candidatus Acidoferrales bacterium]|jgi:uncharacterized membrane protein (DUF2068 family)|nr:DUF2127 domain-containing protein [Candidatus Acidoferrales bacterium]
MSDEQKNQVKVVKPPTKRAPALYFIVGFKLLKGLAALLLALGAYSLTDNNLPDEFRRLLEFLHLDPEKKFFLELADRIGEITPTNLKWVAVGSVVYGLFMLLQAVGLALRVSWIVWLVIAESAFFIPIELFELVRKHVPSPENHPHFFAHPKISVAIVLVANVAIVWYLFKNRDRVMKHHHTRHIDL